MLVCLYYEWAYCRIQLQCWKLFQTPRATSGTKQNSKYIEIFHNLLTLVKNIGNAEDFHSTKTIKSNEPPLNSQSIGNTSSYTTINIYSNINNNQKPL